MAAAQYVADFNDDSDEEMEDMTSERAKADEVKNQKKPAEVPKLGLNLGGASSAAGPPAAAGKGMPMGMSKLNIGGIPPR